MLNERVIGPSKKEIERLKRTLKKGQPLTIPAKKGKRPPKGYTLVNTGKWKWKPSFIRDDAVRRLASQTEDSTVSMSDLIEIKIRELSERHDTSGEDNKGDKIVEKLIQDMERAKLSSLSEESEQLDERRGTPVSGGVEREALKARLAKAMEKDKKGKKGKARKEDEEKVGEPIGEAKDGYYTVVIPPAKKDSTKWHHASKTLTRGAFKTEKEAEAWAKKNIPGHKYNVKMYEEAVIGDRLASELSALLGEDYASEQLPFLLG